MPRIALPDVSANTKTIVVPPRAPTDPPVIKDVANALKYQKDMLDAHIDNKVQDDELVEVEVYKNKVLPTVDGNDPVWLAKFLADLKTAILAPLTAELHTVLTENMAELKAELHAVLAENKAKLKAELRDESIREEC